MSRSIMSLIVLTCTLVLTVVHKVSGDYKLEILLSHYRNPHHILADGSCCDRIHYYHCGDSSVPCYNRFLFCIRPYGSSIILSPRCPAPWHNYTTGTIKSDNISFAGNNYVYQEGGNISVPNPLVFTGKTWPGLFQLFVLVRDWDIFKTKPVDVFIKDWKLDINSTYSKQVRLQGYSGFASLNVSARVRCTDGFFGPNCTYFCNPGSCNFNDPCSVLSPCLNGGSCLNTNINPDKHYYRCVCSGRYSGQNCTEMLNDSLRNFTDTDGNSLIGDGPPQALNSSSPQGSGHSRLLVGTLVGGLITIVLLLLAIIFMAVCIWCKHRDSRSEEETRLTQGSKKDYGGPLDNPTYVSNDEIPTDQYRKLDNPLYDTHHDQRDELKSSTATYENISDIQHHQDVTASARNQLPPSQYSVITRRDSDISSSHTYSDVDDNDQQELPIPVESEYSLVQHAHDDDGNATSTTTQLPIESQYSVITHEQTAPIESGYSVITQSNLGHDIAEASDSGSEGEEDESRKSLLK